MHWIRPERTEGFGKSRDLRGRMPAKVSQTRGGSESAAAFHDWMYKRFARLGFSERGDDIVVDLAIGYKPYALLSQRSLPLLRQEANVGQYVLHFFLSELPAPRMHRTEDDAVLDCSQELLIRLQKRPEAVKIRRLNF